MSTHVLNKQLINKTQVKPNAFAKVMEALIQLTRPIIATAITVALFLLMAYLITPTAEVPQTEPQSSKIDLLREKREEKSEKKRNDKPPKPKPVKQEPPPPVPKTQPKKLKNNDAVVASLPTLDKGDFLQASSANRRATPIVRIPPEYPQGPLNRNIEGWVLVEFTITETGSVSDIQVIDADPKRTFDRAAIRAMKRWKYQPKQVNGKAVPQHNMREVFRFEIQKDQ